MSIGPDNRPKMIYLFSSAPPNRPNYKRGVLNALCYPAGHEMELSYKKSYILPGLFNSREELKGRPGIFVFLDYKKPDHDFIPIRHVTILEMSPKEAARIYRDDTRVYVRIELGPLIFCEAKWGDEIRALPDRPRPYAGQPADKRNYLYVLEGPPTISPSSDYSQRDIWNDMVESLAKTNSLVGCVFVSTSHLRSLETNKQCRLVPTGSGPAYQIAPNSIYKFDVRMYDQRHDSDATQEMVVRSSSDLLSVSQPFATGIGGPTDHSVLVACKRTVEETLVTLVTDIETKAGRSASGAPISPPVAGAPSSPPVAGAPSSPPVAGVIAAKPRFILSIKPPRRILRAFLALVFVGIALTSTSPELYKEFSGFASHPQVWALLSKIAGASALAAAAYLAFRKLPSGSPAG